MGEKYETNHAPQPNDAWNPHSDKQAGISIHQEPQIHANDQAGEGCNTKWYVDASKWW